MLSLCSRWMLKPAVVFWLTSGCAAVVAQHPIYLVRHAERAEMPKDDPPLSETGRARAAALADALSAARIATIITTQLLRTQQTGEAVALRSDARTIKVPAVRGELAAHVAAVVAEAKRARARAPVLVVGHSNTVSEVAAALGAAKLPALCETSFSHLWILGGVDGEPVQFARLRYGKEDAPPTGGCL
jgi:phosphohistidine phosphatase SixA